MTNQTLVKVIFMLILKLDIKFKLLFGLDMKSHLLIVQVWKVTTKIVRIEINTFLKNLNSGMISHLCFVWI